jgi:hypothetical protein
VFLNSGCIFIQLYLFCKDFFVLALNRGEIAQLRPRSFRNKCIRRETGSTPQSLGNAIAALGV